MSRSQRRVLGAIGSLIVVATLAVAVAASARGGDDDHGSDLSAGKGPTSVPETTDTTLPLVPVTAGAPLPTTTAPPVSVPLPSAAQVAAAVPTATPTSGPPPPPKVTGDGAFLVRPDGDSVRPVDKAKGCYSAVDPGWKIVECGALKRDDVVLLWLVESRNKGLRAVVLRERTAGQWAPVLLAADDGGTQWSRIGVRGVDASGDGKPDLLFGFHSRAADRALSIDLVEGPGVVTVHQALASGSARPSTGALDTWSLAGDGAFDHFTLKVIAGAWRIAATEHVPASSVPPSAV